MPKERRDSSSSFERSRASPYPCSSKLPKNSPENEENTKEWEEARCPVCMEHPHNAVLLMCSSHEKGCRPYMCDTSYRHSNCFDQFRKSSAETPAAAAADSSEPPQEGNNGGVTSEAILEGSSSEHPITISCDDPEKTKLVCPLCRGPITGWIVVESARSFMNGKLRSCASETCDFNGTYKDLRKHARVQHPTARPSEADPERQRDWRRLERQRDLGDLISTLQSSMGEERSEESSIMSHDERGWLTVFFLIRVFRPASSLRSGGWPTSRSRGPSSARRRSTRHWGETYDGETGSPTGSPGSRGDDTESSDSGSNSYRGTRRVQRRTTPDNEL